MNNYNICVLGYKNNFFKFLSHIKDIKTKYKLKFILKKTNKSLNYALLKRKIIKNKIKYIAICDSFHLSEIVEDINFYIKNKIKIVRASNNLEIITHGFIIEKPFSDFSFEQLFLRKTLKISQSKHKIIKNKKVLITGGAGSIGSSLVLEVIKLQPKKIIVVDNNEYNFFKLKNSLDKLKYKKAKIDFVLINIENLKLLDLEFKNHRPDIVFHAAALKHVLFLEDNIKQGILTNIFGTNNLLNCSYKYKTKYFIHISTDKAADPKNVLGYTKKLSEYVCHSYRKKIKVGIVRFGNVFNSFGSATEKFKNQINNSQKISLSHPNVERFFMSNIETTNLILATLQNLSDKKVNECRTFIFKMDKPIKIKDLVTKMIYLSGREPRKMISKKYYGLNTIEKISEKLFDKNDKIKNVSNKNIIEIKTKLKKVNYSYLMKLVNSNFPKLKIKKELKKLISK